eukprot:m.77049 g.77049  ORF g.77049 m.77049 type:complete len:333 (-) comp14448_c0_seq8:429-1427(-)
MASSSESSSYGFAANLRRIATIYAVYCLKCKKQIDHQAETLSFIPDPNAKQNVTKGQRGEWRVAALYNEIYRLLLLEQKGSPLTPDEELPDPCNIDDSKLKQPAVRRIKDMLSIVAQAAVYVFRCKDIPLDKPTARLACITDPKFPTKFKKSLAQDTDKLWEDARIKLLELYAQNTRPAGRARVYSRAERAGAAAQVESRGVGNDDDDNDDYQPPKTDGEARAQAKRRSDVGALMAESSSAEKTPKASKLDQALMGKLDSLAEAIKGNTCQHNGFKALGRAMRAVAQQEAVNQRKGKLFDVLFKAFDGDINQMVSEDGKRKKALLQALYDGL